MKPGAKPKPLSDRFWPKVDVRGPDDCWTWTGSLDSGGYGQISTIHGGKPMRASRVSWELVNGPIPDGLHVLHKCDNRPCCNPGHLFLGTNRDNVADMHSKGRARGGSIPGEAHPCAKLSESEASAILFLTHATRFTHAQIGAQFGVDRSTVRLIFLGKKWAHLRRPAPVVSC
jgi:hypothetical protein